MIYVNAYESCYSQHGSIFTVVSLLQKWAVLREDDIEIYLKIRRMIRPRSEEKTIIKEMGRPSAELREVQRKVANVQSIIFSTYVKSKIIPSIESTCFQTCHTRIKTVTRA